MLRKAFFGREERELVVLSFKVEDGKEKCIGSTITGISPFSHPSDIMDSLLASVYKSARFFTDCVLFKVRVVDNEDMNFGETIAEIKREEL